MPKWPIKYVKQKDQGYSNDNVVSELIGERE